MSGLKLRTDNIKHISQPIEVAKNYSENEKVRIAKAAKQFESMLTSMMLKSMTKTTKGMFGEDSFGGDYFDAIFQNKIASYMSEKQGLGISKILYKELTGDNKMPSTVESIHDNSNGQQLNKLGNTNKTTNVAEMDEQIPYEAQSTIDGVKNLESSNSTPKLKNTDKSKVKNNTAAPISPSKKSLQRLSKYDKIINEASKKFRIDKNIIKSVILTESAAKDTALSRAKAKGLMQLIDTTASDMGVKNIWDPKDNIYGGTKYLSKMIKKYNGDVKLALASYNAGPDNVDKYNGVPPFTETKNYISRVLGYYKHFEGDINGNE